MFILYLFFLMIFLQHDVTVAVSSKAQVSQVWRQPGAGGVRHVPDPSRPAQDSRRSQLPRPAVNTTAHQGRHSQVVLSHCCDTTAHQGRHSQVVLSHCCDTTAHQGRHSQVVLSHCCDTTAHQD